ncbi:MAG: YARHG domain-containing protein [Lachnospiraceae bacterium]|nr:YARHG domain-containing protein [Lachnospiraceae bacterium]
MFCEECGKQIPDNSKFCDGCGAPVKVLGERKPSDQAEAPYQADLSYGKAPSYETPSYNRAHRVEQNAPFYDGTSHTGRAVHRAYKEPVPDKKERKKKKGSAQTIIIVILSIAVVALIGVLIVLGIRTFGGKKDGDRKSAPETIESREESSGEMETESSEETESEQDTTSSPSESSVPSSVALETSSSAPMEPVSEYILPTSDSAYLTEADLAALTKEELRLARNEIYARHGRKFKDSGLNNYFMSKSWYVPLIDPDRFNENVFNEYEAANRKLIADYEKKMGY